MRWFEIIGESEDSNNPKNHINYDDREHAQRISPLSIRPERFINDRAIGPAGARDVTGAPKKQFKDKLKADVRSMSINVEDEEEKKKHSIKAKFPHRS
jgi:hypothetical protein